MSIEQQIADASSDFEALILEGWEVDVALAEAATSNDLLPENLQRRLERSGSISDFVSDIRRHAERRKIETQTNQLVEQLVEAGINWFERDHQIRKRMTEWIERSLGRPLTSIETAFALRVYRKIRERRAASFHQEQIRVLREGEGLRNEDTNAPNQ